MPVTAPKNSIRYCIPRIPMDSFTWDRWRLGVRVWRCLGVACREPSIKEYSSILRDYAVGYIPGDRLFCRPKPDETAVLFLIDDEFCWTHFRNGEFEYVFSE